MPCMLVILQAGYAGLLGNNFNPSSSPNLRALVYDPDAPMGRRFSEIANTTIARLYHSVACLVRSGAVLVTGCESCGGNLKGQVRM